MSAEAAAPEPEFVLDKLKHVEPLPGPIWRDRFFAPFIGDSHMDNTELLGMDQKKFGDMAALLKVLSFMVDRTREDRHEELVRAGVTEAQFAALDKIKQIFVRGTQLAAETAKVNTPDQFATFLFSLKSAIRDLAPTEKLLLPAGWRSMDGGHAVMHFIERTESGFNFTVHNTGKGIEYHPSTVTSHPKTKYQTSLKFTNLSPQKMLDDAVWYMYMKMQVSTSDDHRCEVLYEILLPHLLDRTLGVAIDEQQKRDPQAAALCEFRTPQRAEINYLKSMKEALRYILREEGWSAAQTKHFFFLMRRQLIDFVAQDLNQLEQISDAEAKMLRLACQKLSRSAIKESETLSPKRLEADGLEEVYAQIQWVESQITAKVIPHAILPPLDMNMKATFEPFPNFQLFRRTAPVEQFAGWKKDKSGNDLIDMNALPASTADIVHFGHVLQALVTCHSLCERLSAKSSSSAYFHRLALLQDFFTNLLPRPLPPFRSRKPTLDAQGKELPAKECLYATAIIDYATQMQALNLLLELAKHYVVSAKSVSTNRAFEGSHTIVMASIVAITDAVIRIPACDQTSVVTLVLNGTETRFKPKSKNYASPYENMARGRGGLQQAIAGFQSQLGAFGFGGFGAGSAATPATSSSVPKPSAANRANLPTVEVIVPSSTAAATTSTAAATTTTTSAPASTDASSSSTTAASTTSGSPAPATAAGAAAAPMDEETKKKVDEAQRLLTEALASLTKAKVVQQEQMAQASQSKVTPLFYASLANGRGMEFLELSEKLLLVQPSLSQCRGEVLEYFQSQAEVASKAIFTFPSKINCSFHIGKDAPTMELVKVLCQLLGYELNPDADPNDPNASMDDQVSFIEAATWYLTHPKSPLKENQPELFLYRDILALYHIMISQTNHRRSIKTRRWNTADAAINWRIKEVNRARTMIDINLEIMGEEAVCVDALPIYSAADAGSYVTDVHLPTEDDVLHFLNLPSFGDILSEEDAEVLISALTAEYIRIPLVLSFFSSKDRIAVLLNRDVQNMIESVLFEPRKWVSEYDPPEIKTIPAATRAQVGAARGLLLNEIIHNPTVLLSSLLHMAKLTLDLNTGYTSSSREIILYVIRLMVRVEAHLVYVLDNQAEVFRHHRAPTEAYIKLLTDSRAELRTFFEGAIRSVLVEWEAAAADENDLMSSCVIHAHLALLYRGVRASEWSANLVANMLAHSAYLRTWYSAGMTADANEQSDQVGDNFYSSNALGMGTRFGMNHMGNRGMFAGGRGGGMMGRFGGMGGRGLGDDADEPDADGASSSRRRGGRKGRKSLMAADGNEEKKDGEEDKKKSKKGSKGKKGANESKEAGSEGESEDDDEDDLNLPGLGEEVAVEKLKEKNAGEGKASDLPMLEVPDQEVFEALQYVRRGLVNWMASASTEQVDDVLQNCLGVSTRTASVVSRGWKLISSTPGMWRSSNEDLEINVQTAELFFRHSTIEPVPNFISQTNDYTLLFGLKPLHCAMVALHDHRYWARMVGQAYSLKRWDRVEPELVVVNQPVPIPQPNVPNPTWICFNDGQPNPMSAEACSKCNKRERPKFPFGFRFEDEAFGRMFVPPQMQPHEKWIFDAVEPVLEAVYGSRPKMLWEVFLPNEITDPNAQMVHLIGKDDMRTFREIIVHRQRGVAQIYSLLEHGRRVFRSLDYASNSRFSFRYLEPNVKDRAGPWAPQVRHAAGRLLPAFWDASLVITRDKSDEFGNANEETFVPSRFLYGLLPSALLDNFFFWQNSKDHFIGYPRSRTEPSWFYKLHVQLIQIKGANGKVEYSAVVTRSKLDPDTLEIEDPRASDSDGASSFEMKKELTADDPLVVAIRNSKIATLKEMGYSEALSKDILARFDYDLAIAQSWLADPVNATEIERLKSADPATAAAINAASSSSADPYSLANGHASKHQLLLLNLLHAAPESTLYRLGTLLSRIEDLSYILAWTSNSVEAVGAEVHIHLIELPRLKLKLQPRVHVNEKGEETVRLYSLDHTNLFVSDYRDDLLNALLDGLDNSLLFENNERELFVLVPNGIIHRPNIISEPFSAEIVCERGSSTWMNTMESRFFLYPVHNSHTFLLTPTQASAVYLVLLRLLARQYTEAYACVQSCEADMKLSGSEEWILQLLQKADTDFHPNAAAIRLKISLMMMMSQCPFPWRVQDEFKAYLEKLNSVSAICRMSIDEEVLLLKHLKSGAEFEDQEEQEQEEENELSGAPRHLDTALANRLAFLTAMIHDEEEYSEAVASLKFDAKSHDAVPLLTRTRSGRKQCYLEKPVQRGCKSMWSEVENAVDRFYADFSFNARTWSAQIEYSRPDQSATMLGPAIKALNGVWKDTITGLGRKLGFFFLTDLLTAQVDICLTDPGSSSSASLGKLFARLLLLKNSAWGVRFDFAVHRSYRERSWVPYLVCAVLERLPASVAKAAPKLPWMASRVEFINGCSVSNQGTPEGPEMSSAARYLESLLQFTQQFVRMPERANDPRLKVQIVESTETLVVPPIHTFLTAPQPTDFACNQRQIQPFEHEGVFLTEQDCKCFSQQLLGSIDLQKYVTFTTTNERVPSEVPFDVSQHSDAQTHVAKALLTRMNDDVKVYARMVNEGTIPKMACLLDDKLNQILQLNVAENAEYLQNDPALSASIQSSIDSLNQLIVDLEGVASVDYSQIPLAVAAVLDLGNQVQFDDEMSDADNNNAGDTSLHRMQFLIGRYSDLKPTLTLDYLCACLLSTHFVDDLHAVNPFVPKGSEEKILHMAQAFLLRVSRLGHVYRCMSMVVEVIDLLRGIHTHLKKRGPEGKTERLVYEKAIMFKASALAGALATKRFCFGPNAFVKSAVNAGAASSSNNATDLDFEPRYLLFEYLFNILLRNQQVKLLHQFLSSKSQVAQLIMGAGKTTVVGPLLALILADGSRLVTQVVPSALLEFSRSVMRSRFTRIISKRISTLQFDRSVKKIRNVTRIFDKLNAARKTRGIVITSPESIKALMLKHVELMHQLESAPSNLSAPAQLRLKIRSEMADQLTHILNMWKQGNLILDEVDLLLHPLKSELNYPIYEKFPLELSPDRWELPIHLLDAIFFAQTGKMSVSFGQSDLALQLLNEIKDIVAKGVAQHALQTSPHLILLDPDFYHTHLKQPLAQWALFFLKSKQFLSVKVSDEEACTYLIQGPLAAPTEVLKKIRESHNQVQKKMLNLCESYLSSFLPHVLSKINRVTFGLLHAEDMAMVDQNMPNSRKLMAVPFVGKDVPSHASEFSHPDILVSLTILAYRYEGMRRSDARRVVSALQRQMRNQVGPFSTRPASILFDSWLSKGKVYAKMVHEKQVEDEHAEFLAAHQAKQAESGAAMTDAATTSVPFHRRKLRLTPIVPLSIFQLSDRAQMKALFQRVRHLPDLVHFYLEKQVFPTVLQFQKCKLSASGQELGGSMLFDLRYGFSGTPSDLLPMELGACGYELGSEGNIMTTLTNPSIVSTICKDEWSVRKLLSEVANMNAHALIDTGALITGFSNEEVARYLLDHGLAGYDGVVFLDRQDRQMILLRASYAIIPLAQCGLDPSRRFMFYDQIHTTGIDAKHALNANAVLTLGKDMTFRDYAQGAYRMRNIGRGQTITLYIIPEVYKLVQAETKAAKCGNSLIAAVAAWLTVNSMRSERLQFMQLCSQNMRNVWRKIAYDSMLLETTPNPDLVDDRRYWRFQEQHTSEILHVRRCINTFREPIDFSIEADITEARTFARLLKEEVAKNVDLVEQNPSAMAEIQKVEKLAEGAAGANARELQTNDLSKEMVNEQENEQEQKKTVEQEEQAQVNFSREDESQRSWKIFEMARFMQNPSINGTKGSSSFASSSSSVAASSSMLSGLSISGSGTVRDSHPFYPFNRFSIRGVNEKDIDLPPHILLSSNYYRSEWAAMGQRRLKNITIVLEWMPQLAQFQPAPVATSGATASASSSSSASLSPTSTFASSAILSESQELALRTAFKMFDEDGDNLISVAQLKGLMREIGEDLSDHDLQSLVQNDLSYTDFRQFMMNRSLNRKDLHGKRYFVAVSLKEAESLRRLIHTQHPLFAQTDDPSRQVSIGLRMLNGALLDASPAYKPADDAQQSLALQSLRFINAEFFYNDLQLSLLLKALQNNPPRRRQAFFENVLRCRRRDRRRFNDTPLNSIFHLSDEQHLLSYRAKVARVRMCLKSLSLSLQDAFQKFDAHGDAYLNCTELGYALIEYLKLPLNMEDIDQLMEFANKSGNGLLSLEEFLELLREPEIVVNKDSDLLSAQDRAKVTTTTNMEIDEDDDDLPSVPSSTPLLKRNISTTRLTLSPEYERLFHEEEALRVKKQEEVEREIEMAKAEKVAREIEKKQLEEQQAADWKSVQEMRKLTAMEERWTCPACTFKNESTSYHCTVCESKRPEQQERKEDIADMEDIGDGNDGPAFWNCAVCSYNNDNSAAVCEMCNAQKPKVQRAQKKIVSLWSCPTCTRLVTSDKTECDVCSSDREAIRSAAPVSEAKCHDLACLFGTSLIGKDGVPVQSSDLMGKVVGIYFSASWCAPCRAFTPQLASLYQGAVSAGLPFEIVFVSADQDVESFNEYFAKMPWKAVKFSDTDLRKKLNSQFEVQGIPTLIVVNDQGEIITKDGRAELAQGGDTFIAMWCKAEQEKQAAQGKKH